MTKGQIKMDAIIELGSTPVDTSHEDYVSADDQAFYDRFLDEWGDRAPFPLMPIHSDASEFPLDCLGELQYITNTLAEGLQIPAALAAQSVLSCASLAVQSRANTQNHLGAIFPLSLFFLTIIEPGSRKDAVDRIAFSAVKLLQEKLHKMVEGKVLSSDEAGARLSVQEIKELFASNTHIIQDVPVDVLSETLAGAKTNVLYVGDNIEHFVGRVTSKSKIPSGLYLSKLWDNSHAYIKGGKNSFAYRECALSLNLSLEVEATEDIFGALNFCNSQHILSKFLIANTKSMAGNRSNKGFDPNNFPEIEVFNERIIELMGHNSINNEGGANYAAVKTLKIEPAAEDAFLQFIGEVERESLSGNSYYLIRHFTAKASEHILKISGVMAIYEDIESEFITLDHIIRAQHIFIYYATEYITAFENSLKTIELNKAQKLLNWFLEETKAYGDDLIGYRYTSQRAPLEFRTKKVLEHYLDILEDHGWVVRIIGRKYIKIRRMPELYIPPMMAR